MSSILDANDTTYYQICTKMENYITSLPGDLPATFGAGSGEEGEDEFVARFAKWRNFWRGRVAPDGTMSIFSQTIIALLSGLISVCNSPIDDNITWRQLGPFNSQGSSTGAKNCYGGGAPNSQNQGRIDAVCPNPNNTQDILAGGNNGGIWRTQDGGQTWTNTTADEGFNMVGINKIIRHPQNPNIVFALTQVSGSGYHMSAFNRRIYGIGILYSNDGGNTWFRTNNPQPFTGIHSADGNNDLSKSVLDIGIPPDSPVANTRLYITTANYLYYAQLDLSSGIGSATAFNWVELYNGTGPWNATITGFAIQPSDQSVWITYNTGIIDPGTTTGFKLYKYTYSTAATNYHTETIVPLPTSLTPPDRITLHINTTNQMVLSSYVGKNLQIRHLDLGNPSATWVAPTNSSGILTTMGIGSTNSDIIYAEHMDQFKRCMYKSTNGGITFLVMNNYPNHVDKRTLFVLPGAPHDILFLGTDGGVSACTDGHNWVDITGEGIANTNFFGVGITEHNADFIIGGAQDGSINMYNHQQWYETAPDQSDNGDCAISPANPNVIYQEKQNAVVKTILNANGTNTPTSGSYYCTAFCPPASIEENFYYSPLLFNPTNAQELFFGRDGQLALLTNATNGTLSLQTIPNAGLYSTPKSISSIAMAAANPNVVYYSLFGAFWNNPNALDCGAKENQFSGIFKSVRTIDPVTGNQTWVTQNKTNNMYVPVTYNCSPPENALRLPASITDIAVDPNNENRIWVCYDGFVSNYKVWYSADGGENWTPMNGCFPNIPASAIAYQPDSPNRIFVGTDAGVFFTDDTMEGEWAYYANGGPQCLIADIEINRCDNKLVVATHGSGMWEVDLPPANVSELVISANTNFSDDMMMFQNIVIQSGATLTLTPGAILRMAKDRTITIQPGGILHVNNATITDLCKRAWGGIIVQRGAKLIVNGAADTPSNPIQAGIITTSSTQRWQGIEVWGNTTVQHASVLPGANPALLTPADYINATLTPTDPGIVVLHNGATIENARTAITTQRRGGYFPNHYGGIVFAQNSNFTNNRKAVELMQYKPDNYSRFINCQITANTNHNIAFEGITVWDCNNIVIDHCTFENNNPDIYALSAAITTHDAERLQIINNCRFTDVAKGIILQATNAGLGNASIKDNTFTNCRLGIQNFETREMIVEGNTFTTNAPAAQHITLAGNCGYSIRENTFVNGTAAVAAFFTSLLTPGYNLIDCNTFQNCGTGVYANNNNSGLHFQNNDFATLNADVQLDNNGTLPNQGIDDGFGNFLPYFNFFTLNNPTTRITTTGATNPFFYYYHTDPTNFTSNANDRLVPHCFAGEIPPFPGCGTTYNYNAIEILIVPVAFNYSGCLDLNGDGFPGMLPPDEDCKTRACLDSLKLLIAGLEDQKDGGNKNELLNDLYNSPEALETYQKYLNASPYLTDEVLAEAAENPLLSPTRKANILLANAPLSNDMMNTAYQHVTPAVYQTLYAIKYYLKISDRDRLDMRIGTEVQKKEALFTQLYTQYLHKNHTDSLHSLLIAENTLFAQRCWLTNLTRQGSFADALTLLNSLPATTPDEQDYKTVQQINLQFQSATQAFSLSETQYQTLRNIADAQGYQAPAACALLSLLRGEHCEWQIPAYTPAGKTTPPPYPQVPLIDLKTANRLWVQPNPAKEQTIVNIPVFLFEKNTFLEIFDINGKLLYQISIQEGQTNVLLDTEKWVNGLYLLSLRSNDVRLAHAKLIIKH